MYVETIHPNLVVANFSLLGLEDTESWIKKMMPHVQNICFYCRSWLWKPILPPKDSEKVWKVYSFKVRNLDENEQHKAVDLAIQEVDPLIPTLCFVEFLDDISQNKSRNEDVQEKRVAQASQYEGPKEEID